MEYGLGLILSIAALVFGLPFFIRKLRQKIKKEKEYRTALAVISGVYMLGYLLPVLWPSLARGKWMRKILFLGFAASLLTEVIQLILRLGWFDIDDLLNNVLGILAGLWLYRNLLTERRMTERKVRHHGRKTL